MKTDSLFYRLFADNPALVFELIGDTSPRTGSYAFGSQEVKQTRFQLDGILNPPPYASDLPIVFVEVMGYKDRKRSFYHGFFTEINLYLNDYQPPNDWIGVVIFTEKRLDPGLPNHFQEYANSRRLHRVYLDRLAASLGNGSIELGVLQLIGLNQEQVPERARQLLQRAREQLTDGVQQQRLVELLVTTIAYKFSDFTPQEVQLMLGLDELKQTRFYQDAQQEGLEQGIEQGREEERQLMLSRTVPMLLRAGLSIDQIAQQLQVEVEAVRLAAQ